MLKLPSHAVSAHLLVLTFLFVLLVHRSDLLVQEYVTVHRLFASPLHCLVELGCVSLVSGLSLICLPKSFSDLSSAAFLDLLITPKSKSWT